MAVDVVLWFILAFMIAWIGFGCHMTAPARRQRKIPDSDIEQRFDRAA